MNAITKEFTRVMPKKIPGLVIVTAGILPLYILGVAGKTAAIPLSLLILVAMVMVAAFMGPKLSLAISPLVALGFAGTAYVSDKPLAGALFVAVVAFLCRAAMVSSKAAMLILIAIFMALFVTGPPLLTGHNPVTWGNIRDIFLWSLGACLWACFIGWLLTLRVPIPKLPALPSLKIAAVSGLLIGLLVGVATWVVLDHHLGKGGGWLILTLFIVFQPFTPGTMLKAAHRAIGTLLGFFLLSLLLLVEPNSAPAWAFALPGILAMTAAFMDKLKSDSPYWEYVMFLTLGVVLIEGSGSGQQHLVESIRHLSVLRLHYTIIGVVIGLIATALFLGVQNKLSSGALEEISTHV